MEWTQKVKWRWKPGLWLGIGGESRKSGSLGQHGGTRALTLLDLVGLAENLAWMRTTSVR